MTVTYAIWAIAGLAALCVVGFGVWFLYYTARAALLMRRFGDEDAVDTILSGNIAQGMTRDMVIAAWGHPVEEAEDVLKTKSKLQMKYDHRGHNRFGTRVYLENGAVVGWERR